jgi:hypothetical protein
MWCSNLFLDIWIKIIAAMAVLCCQSSPWSVRGRRDGDVAHRLLGHREAEYVIASPVGVVASKARRFEARSTALQVLRR